MYRSWIKQEVFLNRAIFYGDICKIPKILLKFLLLVHAWFYEVIRKITNLKQQQQQQQELKTNKTINWT